MPIVAPPVRPGDTLAVVSPSSPFDEAILQAGLARLAQWGFKVKLDPDVRRVSRYTSGDAETRARSLNRALSDPEVKAVIAARGGYGAVHLLPLLDLGGFAAHPKRLVGCSDVTTLLQHVWKTTGVITYHGPMVAAALGREPGAETEADFLAMLAGAPSPAHDRPLEVLVAGDAAGTLTGGCLTLLCASLGTPYEFEADGRILFLEDVKEHPYRIDRMLTQLLKAGKLDCVRGVVFGQMEGCEAPAGSDYRLQDVVFDLLRHLGVPVYFGFPSGHASPNLTLPIGASAKMTNGRLSVSGY